MEAWLKEYKLDHLAVALEENGFTDPCDWANVKSLRQFDSLVKLLPINFMDSCKLEAAWRQFNKLDEVDSDSENKDANKGQKNDTNKGKPKDPNMNQTVSRAISRGKNKEFFELESVQRRLSSFFKMYYVHVSHVLNFLISNNSQFTWGSFEEYLKTNQIELANGLCCGCFDCSGSPRYQLSFAVQLTHSAGYAKSYFTSHYTKSALHYFIGFSNEMKYEMKYEIFLKYMK
eukprot:817637_1